jgi:hypothetical protein
MAKAGVDKRAILTCASDIVDSEGAEALSLKTIAERLHEAGHLPKKGGHQKMEAARKKELLTQYRERKITGGIYLIKNAYGGKTYLDATTDINASKSRFEFSKKTGVCAYKTIQGDWDSSGPDAFSFEVLEEYEKSGSQTMKEFETDIAALKALWAEKLSTEMGVGNSPCEAV